MDYSVLLATATQRGVWGWDASSCKLSGESEMLLSEAGLSHQENVNVYLGRAVAQRPNLLTKRFNDSHLITQIAAKTENLSFFSTFTEIKNGFTNRWSI